MSFTFTDTPQLKRRWETYLGTYLVREPFSVLVKYGTRQAQLLRTVGSYPKQSK